MRISRSLLDQIIQHSIDDRPDECCGMVSGSGGAATEVFRARNALASPYSFNIDEQDLFRIYTTIEDRGEDLLAIYHSHTKSPAEPSQQDRNQAKLWPDPVWLICSLADPENPVVRGWDMRDGGVAEVDVVVY